MTDSRVFNIEKNPAGSYYIFQDGSLLAIQSSIESVMAYISDYVSRTPEKGSTYIIMEDDEIIN